MKRLAAAALTLALASASAPAQRVPVTDEDWLRNPGANTTGAMIGLFGGIVPGHSIDGKGRNEGFELPVIWASSYGVTGGYGFSPHWAAYLTIDRSDHNVDNDVVTEGTVSLHHVEAGIRYVRHYYEDRLAGYTELGFGMRQWHSKHMVDPAGGGGTVRATITGRQFAPGLGAQWFVARRFAVDANVHISIGDANRLKITGRRKESLNSDTGIGSRFRLGMVWYPISDI